MHRIIILFSNMKTIYDGKLPHDYSDQSCCLIMYNSNTRPDLNYVAWLINTTTTVVEIKGPMKVALFQYNFYHINLREGTLMGRIIQG